MGARVVKRYTNRKLYDTKDSRYVTLQQIAEFVRDGEDVRIIDNKSKEDLTNVTLAQIIYEEQKHADENGDRTSVGPLRSFIQQGRECLMTSLREGRVGRLVSWREEDGQGSESPASGDGATAEGDTAHAGADGAGGDGRSADAWRSPKEAFEELQRLADDRVRSLVGHAMTHVQQLQGEVRRLQARIEELEDRLKAGSRRSSSGDHADDE